MSYLDLLSLWFLEMKNENIRVNFCQSREKQLYGTHLIIILDLNLKNTKQKVRDCLFHSFQMPWCVCSFLLQKTDLFVLDVHRVYVCKILSTYSTTMKQGTFLKWVHSLCVCVC